MEYTQELDLLFLLLIIFVPLIADLNIRLNYKKYLKTKNKKGLTGSEVAREILKENNLDDIYVVETNGFLTDHYDPARKVIRLSANVYNDASVASIAIAAHECGHAIQDKEGYTFFKVRSLIFPIVNIVTSISYYIIFIGLILSLMKLFYIGIAFTFCGLIFQVITLPVEFNASKRAKKEIEDLKLANSEELSGVKKVLNSAALTYVAGVLASMLQILRLILLARDRD